MSLPLWDVHEMTQLIHATLEPPQNSPQDCDNSQSCVQPRDQSWTWRRRNVWWLRYFLLNRCCQARPFRNIHSPRQSVLRRLQCYAEYPEFLFSDSVLLSCFEFISIIKPFIAVNVLRICGWGRVSSLIVASSVQNLVARTGILLCRYPERLIIKPKF